MAELVTPHRDLPTRIPAVPGARTGVGRPRGRVGSTPRAPARRAWCGGSSPPGCPARATARRRQVPGRSRLPRVRPVHRVRRLRLPPRPHELRPRPTSRQRLAADGRGDRPAATPVARPTTRWCARSRKPSAGPVGDRAARWVTPAGDHRPPASRSGDAAATDGRRGRAAADGRQRGRAAARGRQRAGRGRAAGRAQKRGGWALAWRPAAAPKVRAGPMVAPPPG